jgi:hypothetical protein
MDATRHDQISSPSSIEDRLEELVFSNCESMMEMFRQHGIPVDSWGLNGSESPETLFAEHNKKRGARFFLCHSGLAAPKLVRKLHVACLVVVSVRDNQVKFLFEEWTQRPGKPQNVRGVTMAETLDDGEDAFSGCCRALKEEAGLGEMGRDFAVKVWRTATVEERRGSSTYHGLWTLYEKHFVLVSVDVFDAGKRKEFFNASGFKNEEEDHGSLTLCFSWIAHDELIRRCRDANLVAFVKDSAAILSDMLTEPDRCP